jgi:hypothetical protein
MSTQIRIGTIIQSGKITNPKVRKHLNDNSVFYWKSQNCFNTGVNVTTFRRQKIAVFWIVAPCSLVEVYRRFRGPCCLDLWNVGKLLPDYTALQPRRQPSSYSPLWDPQILHLGGSFQTLKLHYVLLCIFSTSRNERRCTFVGSFFFDVRMYFQLLVNI